MDFAKLNLADNQELAREIIVAASMETFKDRREFEKFRNQIIKKRKGVIFHNLYFIKAYRDLLAEGEIRENPALLKLIQKRGVRTMSGVAPVTVLTKPWPCPGRCVYCPTDARMPKSYLPSQPAAQRAFRQRFNPYTQVFVRLKALQTTGHEVSKVELRIIGGTWSAYPRRYQRWFVKQCLMAMNEFFEQTKGGKADRMEDLVREEVVQSIYGEDRVNTVILKALDGGKAWDEVVHENETAKVRCIGINVETRPDHINKREIRWLRELGVTKVEMGVQTTDDEVQKLTRRGHTNTDVVNATRLLKDAGFKIGYHMMPNLPGSSVVKDKKMVGELFNGADYQPDYLKIYPCVVMPRTILSKWYRDGKHKPYSEKVLEEVLAAEIKDVPEWCRIDRIARDIPANEVEAGFRVSNVRQILEIKLLKEGTPCRDIRAREIGGEDVDASKLALVRREYDASGGKELFLSFEDVKKDKLAALLRVRIPGGAFIDGLKDAVIVREIHVYGRQVSVGKRDKGSKQHGGLGTQLMNEAEKFARENGYKKIAVIAGIGTREYYKKLKYKLEGSYMVKYT
jgi:elongator complex protein 3 (tRNA carboxymethyluridine synthase)